MSGFFSRVLIAREAPGVAATLLRQAEPRRLPPHAHHRPYFSLLVSGSYVERVGIRELEHRAASLVYHPGGLEHVDAYGKGGGLMLVVKLDPSRSSWQEAPAPRDPLALTRRGALHAAWRVVRALDPDLPTIALEEAAADLHSHVAPAIELRQTRRPKWLDRVIERLRQEYPDPPGLAELADDAGVHASHLSRTLRRFEGRGIAELVQLARVEHVWRQLVSADAPSLVDASLAAGFADQSHCNRVFKRHVGESPGAFLRQKGDIPLFRQ